MTQNERDLKHIARLEALANAAQSSREAKVFNTAALLINWSGFLTPIS